MDCFQTFAFYCKLRHYSSGRLVLAFNNRAGAAWGGVLSLAVSEDGGATFPWVRDLEPGSQGEQVQPAVGRCRFTPGWKQSTPRLVSTLVTT